MDIVKLNIFGNRAKGVAPRALEDYEILGDTVYSPCEGTVLAARSDLPDTVLGEVGNSGNSLEPHLHVGARNRDAELGLVFAGRWLSANSVVMPPERSSAAR